LPSNTGPAAEIVEHAVDAIFIIHESGQILFSNPAAEKLFGFAFPEIEGKSISALIPPPLRGRRRANYIQNAEGAALSGVRKSGERFPLDLMLSELPTSPRRFSIIVRDRSNRNRIEKEIEDRHRFAASLIDHLPALLVVIDSSGRIVRFNRAAEELTQFSEGEIRGQFLWQSTAAPAAMELAEQQTRSLLAGEFPCRTDSEWCLRDNSLRSISWSHEALRDEYGAMTHVVSVGVDITVRRQLEERRRETEALSAAGRVAGGVAHDFNNLLTAITGYSGLLLDALPERDPVRGDVEEIKRASDRGASLTRQLLAFSGKHPWSPKPINLNDAVKNTERLLRVMLGDSIHLDFSLEPELPLVLADSEQVEECIMHLAANAKDAMRNGGTLQIQTGVRSLTRRRLDARPPIGPGDYVTVSVVDTGTGIPSEALPNIFEPFFSTRNSPRANGMGLAIVYGIVRKSEGSIVVHSAPQLGSTFRLLFPLASGQRSAPRAAEPPEESLFGEETVLLAMEPDLERKRLRQMLESASYRVLEARSALQALEMAHKNRDMIHLLISDVRFLKMRGHELAESVCASRPAIRVLYATSRSGTEGLPDVLRVDRTLERRTLLERVRAALRENKESSR
jgi:PAS domain S-box-containing protein